MIPSLTEVQRQLKVITKSKKRMRGGKGNLKMNYHNDKSEGLKERNGGFRRNRKNALRAGHMDFCRSILCTGRFI